MSDNYVALLGTKGGPAIRPGSSMPTSSLYALNGQKIIVEGHTDNEPLEQVAGASEYNLKLGFERATNVFKYLNLKHGIPQERVAIFSYGTSKPLSPETGHSPAERKKNRRVVFRLSAHHY